MKKWDIAHGREMYSIGHWSGGYFDINEEGHLVARPTRDQRASGVDLFHLAQEIRQAGLSYPVLVRFSDILRDRVETLCQAFGEVMDEDRYTGKFTAVYPIKVNQQRTVVREILSQRKGQVGLEAGSKPELMAVLALSEPNGVVVCNGYKDREYIRLALIGKQLGHRVYIVVEKLSELQLVIEEARDLKIRPLIGVRVRLASIGAGKWQNTGGEKSKFGLSANQVLSVIDYLRKAEMLDTLQLLHCHLGSQIPNIRDIQRGMREVARYYAELNRLGVTVKCVDVGGGLGIDYEGTRSRSFCSINYSVREYAKNVVHAIWEVCEELGLPHPDIITESGRAITAHHAMLITNVIDIEQVPALEPSASGASDDDPLIIQDLYQTLTTISESASSARSAIEAYHDAVHWLSEAQSMYTHGVLSLEQRARAEQLYYATCWKVRELLQPATRVHRELFDELNEKLADKYFCNFSLFQSLPDIWAIDQIFPIVPLHRLDERPTRRATLQDITCDSDGRIDHYVDGEGVESSLPVHSLRDGETYLLGIFLVGAYQEILGDMHNLFGDTDSVNVEMSDDGGHRLLHAARGDTVDSVLRFVNFNIVDLLTSYKNKIASADISSAQRKDFLLELEAGLTGYTYLED